MEERILVIDDERRICALLKEFFESRGYEVETASNVYSAIRKLKECDPSIIFLDIRMPDVEGLELLQIIKKTMRRSDVIMISGNADATIAREAMEEGAVGYVVKPIDLTYLLRLLLSRVAMHR